MCEYEGQRLSLSTVTKMERSEATAIRAAMKRPKIYCGVMTVMCCVSLFVMLANTQ